jgi:hypothetical protein
LRCATVYNYSTRFQKREVIYSKNVALR